MRGISGRSSAIAVTLAVALLLSIIHLTSSATAMSPLTTASLALPVDTAPKLHIRLYTHNIRFAKTFFREPNEKPWSKRRSGLVRELLYTAQPPTTIVLLQEALHQQVRDVLSSLRAAEPASDWAFVGVGRDDGGTHGEYSPIFFRRAVWALEANDTAWFCEDTTAPGCVCWGANNPRILTMARLRHRATDTPLVAMNTHLDNAAPLSREMSARIIRAKIDEWGSVGTDGTLATPVFVGGDFNSPPSDGAYRIMVEDDAQTADLRELVDESRRYGDLVSFTGFEGNGGRRDDDPAALLDFLFLAPKRRSPWTAVSYACLPNVFDDGVYMSDHRAAVGDVHLNVTNEDASELFGVEEPPQQELC